MRRVLPAVASIVLLVTTPAAQRKALPPSIDLVEIDVGVLDRKGQPVSGLSAADFTVKEDGSPVEVKTFTEVRPTPNDPDRSEERRVGKESSSKRPEEH